MWYLPGSAWLEIETTSCCKSRKIRACLEPIEPAPITAIFTELPEAILVVHVRVHRVDQYQPNIHATEMPQCGDRL